MGMSMTALTIRSGAAVWWPTRLATSETGGQQTQSSRTTGSTRTCCWSCRHERIPETGTNVPRTRTSPMKILVLSDLHLAHLAFSAVHEAQRIDEHVVVFVRAGDIDGVVGGFRGARKISRKKP